MARIDGMKTGVSQFFVAKEMNSDKVPPWLKLPSTAHGVLYPSRFSLRSFRFALEVQHLRLCF
jgi:hypothetical protein